MQKHPKAVNMDPIPFSDIYAEINDMVKPASQPDGLTLKDLTSCGRYVCLCVRISS